MKFKALQMKRRFISGKTVVGIDPAKKKHQAAILDDDGLQLGKPFTFKHNHDGFSTTLRNKIQPQLPECNPENLVFAVETSCSSKCRVLVKLNSVCTKPFKTRSNLNIVNGA